MPRIRSVHPEICLDDVLALVTDLAERTFVRLWTHLDDEGRAIDNPQLLKAALYPLRDEVTIAGLDAVLWELASYGLLTRYTVASRDYLTAKPQPWKQWQKPRHRYPSKLPAADDPRAETRRPPAEADSNEIHEQHTPSDVGPTHVRPAPAGEERRGGELERESYSRNARGLPANDQQPAAATDTTSTTPTLDDALQLLTSRELLRNPTRGPSVGRHTTAVLNAKRRDHAQRAHQLLHINPELTPAQLADLLEPSTPAPTAAAAARPAPDPYAGQRAARDRAAADNARRLADIRATEPADPDVVAQALDDARQAARQAVQHPHQETPDA